MPSDINWAFLKLVKLENFNLHPYCWLFFLADFSNWEASSEMVGNC